MHKVLFVTGASSDFGIRFMERNAANYETIIAHYCNHAERLQKLQEQYGNKIILKQANLCDAEAVHRMMQELSESGLMPDHILHLAAKKLEYQRFSKRSAADFEEELQCSVLSLVEILRTVLPAMARKKSGKVVVMLSACVCAKPPKFMSTYTVSKYALLGTVLALAEEYAEKGICINAVSPEMTDTAFLSEISPIIVEMNRNNNVMKRNLCVDDVVPTLEYLFSAASDKVTGQNLFITGVK